MKQFSPKIRLTPKERFLKPFDEALLKTKL
ncbi:hypothetical protein N402_03140 [Helicobacter pylori FD423]|nr:hypothetical protein N402_03140 [Helicobacter pylori FD423]